MTIADFLTARAAETYPEPRTDGHDKITGIMAPVVAALLRPGAFILDVGCGQGAALEWFTAHGFDATGITTNADDLRACKAAGFNEVYLCDMHDMSQAEPSSLFDCIWARHVLEHSPIPFYVLCEMARELKPGGILYAEMPAPDTACHHESNANHYSVLGWEAWSSLIQRAGFVIMEGRQLSLATAAGKDVYFSFIARKS